MNRDPIPFIEELGYTPREATFLYAVGMHSGYFLRRQFDGYIGRVKGAISQRFLNKAERQGHIRALDYGQNRKVFHLYWKPIYRLLGDEDSQHRRVKGDLQVKIRLMILDYVLDELFMLGLERDNDLWMRGHIGTHDGRKGSAPLGRSYFLSNWEADKNVYGNGLLTVKLGPFLDTGEITDPAPELGSHKWLCDTGAQLKLNAFGTEVVFSYGKDLRSGSNVFYLMMLR